MLLKYLPLLCSPKTKKTLQLTDAHIENGRVRSGNLTDGENSWPIINFIPRFVPENAYWDSFSFQWNKHPTIMQELYSGLTLYRERFKKETKWGDELGGQIILEAGCGVGSFTQLALETGATIVSFDVSTGVDVNYKSNGNAQNLLIVQASIYEMPFIPIFDKVFCFGVLQHTPDPHRSFAELVRMIKPCGSIATDIYADVPLTYRHGLLKTKYFLRKWTAGVNPEKLYKIVSCYVNIIWRFCRMIQKLPFGLVVSQHLMIDQYSDRLSGMNQNNYREYAIIEIFDMLSPLYDYPQTIEAFTDWHNDCALKNIEVHYGYNGIEGRGGK